MLCPLQNKYYHEERKKSKKKGRIISIFLVGLIADPDFAGAESIKESIRDHAVLEQTDNYNDSRYIKII